MAITKAKRSVHPSKAAQRKHRRTSTRHPDRGIPALRDAERRHQISLPKARLFHFREARGKIVEAVEFSAAPDHQDFSIKFRDKTGFNFTFNTVFTLKTEYSDWKSGEQRILRTWPLIKT